MDTKTFNESHAISKKHELEIIQKLAPYLIVPPPENEDLNNNTDLWLAFQSCRIAYRVREYNSLSYFMKDFTIRYRSAFGYASEYDKILAGHGDLFFYGLTTPDGSKLSRWVLYDLKRLGVHWNRQKEMHGINWLPGTLKYNGDGSQFLTVNHMDDFIITKGEICIT